MLTWRPAEAPSCLIFIRAHCRPSLAQSSVDSSQSPLLYNTDFPRGHTVSSHCIILSSCLPCLLFPYSLPTHVLASKSYLRWASTSISGFYSPPSFVLAFSLPFPRMPKGSPFCFTLLCFLSFPFVLFPDRSLSVAQAGLEFAVALLPAECWGCRHGPPFAVRSLVKAFRG